MTCALVVCTKLPATVHHEDTHYAFKGDTMDCVNPRPAQGRCWQCEPERSTMAARKLPLDVENMINRPTPTTPTASLDQFVPAYQRDDNIWWMVGCGHHMNLFDAALEKLAEMGWKPEP